MHDLVDKSVAECVRHGQCRARLRIAKPIKLFVPLGNSIVIDHVALYVTFLSAEAFDDRMPTICNFFTVFVVLIDKNFHLGSDGRKWIFIALGFATPSRL